MLNSSAIADLEKRIERAYEAHSAKRVAIAAMLVGVVSIGTSWAVYYFFLDVLIAIGAFALSSFLTVNVAMFMVVPPVKQLADSKALMIGAIKDPMRIQSIGDKKVKLADQQHHVRPLSAFEQSVWNAIVIPYFIKMRSGREVERTGTVEGETVTAQKKVMDKRQAELTARAAELMLEREKLDQERIDLEMQAKELKKVQAQLEDRTSRMEASEAELARLKENQQRRLRETVNLTGAERALLEQKADELKAKELELEGIKRQLESDRNQ